MTNANFSELKRLKHPPRYLPGLDGLRAISVIGIIIYHLNAQWLSGGFLGVDTFFVISGYLITSLLLFEYENNGQIDLVNFWLKRFKRLIPAMLFVVLFSVIYVVFFEPEILKAIKGDAVAALVYISNWWYIFQDIDYFDQFKPMPLKHLWSLAVEEQFYIFYPLVLLAFLKIFKQKKWVVITFFIISILSAFWMFHLSMPDANNSRTYFGTDTRLQTLLLGVVFAFIWPAFKLKTNPAKSSRMIVDILGGMALLVLLTLFVAVNEQQFWLYSGGFYVISLLTLLIIASVVQPKGMLAKAMGNPLFLYVGKRSYSLYLWHFVIITFVHKNFVAGQYPLYVYFIDVILTFLMAEISYRYVETPFRRHGLRAFYMKEARVISSVRTLIITAAIIMTTLVLAGCFDSFAKQEQKVTEYKTEKKEVQKEPEPSVEEPSQEAAFDPKKLSPLFIGDSLTVGMGYYLDEHYQTPTIDAQVGRSIGEAINVAPNYASYNKEGQVVVIQIGTNGDFDKAQIEELVRYFDKADVYVVNTTVPRDYRDHVNGLLEKTAKKYKHVTLVDWYSAGVGHTEFFAYDGIHLEHPGIQRLVEELDKNIKENQSKE
ncbi:MULTISPECIES: acyltransferase family protein [unclassified Staphylococcus]|uniref:acyltransferase family protein n=1 Tax=unclassified Staphylococcus TaxID=91994 RepID=UPI0021CF8443|nr:MULTISPECIES: acyltransferase family protein [unclassified Staphylococcus]UXR70161.1 acyltransferase [Staphylococcus sp. IVB6246]UXR72220.1 acyltransferase [Staphylococcus sp. IVB6240]UXR74529.1 acyltransferase [Staphylococcus sp. IVB6238]UXR76913.1 acyltransferase [Staphylococcus sp. IVB6233]UXR81039.1 acyltransferase [Staphylococcus sp. IVB6218]